MEETRELFEAAMLTANKPYITESVIGIADACADMLYVIYGAGITYGFSLVHSPNKNSSFLLGYSHQLAELPREKLSNLLHFGMEHNRRYAEAVIKKDLALIEESLNNLLNFTYAVSEACGIKIDSVFREVQRSNMSKIWEDGTVHRRESDGKIMKPPTYSPADINGVLIRQ
jgi:predicted HAD superfamily Cof-like phosphohydrolase